MKTTFILEISNNMLFVLGKIPYISGDELPQITINKNAKVEMMQLNEEKYFVKKVNPSNDYFITYSLNNKQDGLITVEYSTPIDGWPNQISEELIAISLYSTAFSINLPDYIDSSVCYFKNGFENYDIYDSYFDKEVGLYAKCSKKCFGEIVNIIAFKKGELKSFELGKIKVFYREASSYKNLYECASIGLESFQYYNEIYGPKEIKDITLVVLGNGQSGAYIRDNLIVLGEAPEEFNIPEFRELLKYQVFAHELGHIWFNKANVKTYEDWLNETGAEWSSLLFILHKGQNDIFGRFMNYYYETQRARGEEIKPKDLHHPDTVHTSGVVLFNMIYEKYGKDTIILILQLLSKMDNQNTDDFISIIKNELSEDIAEFINNNINYKIKC